MTKKARYIEKLDALSADEKKAAIDFFTKYPNYEEYIDWNNKALRYHDFEEVFALAGNPLRDIKQKPDPIPLFGNCNCEIIRRTDIFLVVVPFDWECAVFFNSSGCGGEEAHWCVGEAEDAAEWNRYVADKNIFFLVFFVTKDPVFGKKILIQYDTKNGVCTPWLLDNSALNKIPDSLDTVMKSVLDNAQRLLPGLCIKDYILNGSTLVKCCNPSETITLPAGVTAIGDGAFSGCANLTAISVEEGDPRFASTGGVLFDKIEKRLLRYPAKKEGIQYTIPAEVTAIGGGAFADCTNLEVITLPTGLTAIGDEAFYGCKNLKDIIVDEKNPRFVITDGVLFDKIEHRLLWYPVKRNYNYYTIPDGITAIGSGVFAFCEILTVLTIPASLTSIGDRAFHGCRNLNKITVKEGNPRFVVTDGVLFDKIEHRLLRYPVWKHATHYTIPADVTSIGDSAFFGCEYLSGIIVDEKNLCGVIIINGVLFDKNERRLLWYPAGKQDAHYTIPAGVTAIEDYAFAFCRSLSSITLPAGLTSIGDTAFEVCYNLKSIIVDEKNPRFASAGGVLFDKIEHRLLCYPAGKKDTHYTIPAGVTAAADCAFWGCRSLSSITLPASLTSIGDTAFSGCENLNAIIVDEKNPRLASTGGVLFDKIKHRLLRYPAKKKDTHI
jgi:hypothetical protein